MSQWIERVNTHTIWGEMEALGMSIDTAAKRSDNDVETIDGLERLRSVLTLCGKRLAATDPIFIHPQSLVDLTRQLTAIKSEIETFTSDGSASHIVNANANADEAITALSSILAPIMTDDLTVINESVSSYRTALEKYMQSASITQQNLKAASDANEASITAQALVLAGEQQKLAALILEHQTQFSTAQDKRASEFSAVLAEQQTKYAATAAEQQTQFSKDQDERKSTYASSQIANQEKFSSLIAEYSQTLKDKDKEFEEKLTLSASAHETNLEQLKLSYEQSAQEVLTVVNQHKVEIEKLVGVIGNLGVTSGYQKVANLARWMLFLWQFITVVALGGLIWVAFLMAFPSSPKILPITIEASHAINSVAPQSTQQSSDKIESVVSSKVTQAAVNPVSDSSFYQGLATRIFLSLTFGIFAAYAAKQASHFLEMERKNRKQALDLEALGSYIAPLNKAQQDEFRLKIGDRSFGVPDEILNKQKTDDPVTVLDALKAKELIELLVSKLKIGS